MGRGAPLALPVGVGTLSLRTRLLLLAIVPALLTGPLLVLVTERMDRQATAWAESRSLGVARLLASAAGPTLDFDDGPAADRLLSQLGAVPGARFATLRRRDGTTLGRWGQPVELPGWPPAGEQVLTRGDLLHVHVPMTTRGGQRGALVVGFGLDELHQRRREARTLVGGVAVALVALVALALVAVTRLVARPLGRITEVARRIAAGEETARQDLAVHQTDELGTLARAFDVMLQRLLREQQALQDREQAITVLNAGLEARVAERTEALERANLTLSARLADLKAAQDQLVVAERRAGIGRLAAGVAHEINNPLSYVSSNIGFVADELEEARGALVAGGPGGLALAQQALSEALPALTEARQGAGRVQQIVRGLKTFSRGDEDVRTPVDVSTALGAAIDMAHNQIKHRARLEREERPVGRVEANEVRLAQVFLNLLLNAAQAIPEGQATQHRIRAAVRPDGPDQVVVEISDTGAGMTPEVQARLFEPFFTTKRNSEGTGLGLAISQGIVHSYGGTIEVRSEPGRGSTFLVRLPASARVAVPRPAVARAPERRRRLLVVDDEASVGTGMVRVLSRQHEVTAVRSAREGLDLLRRGQPFDRILCDLEMPEMTGPDFRDALAQLDPALAARVIFMTGGAFTERSVKVMTAERNQVLDKPVDFDRLRRMLDEP